MDAPGVTVGPADDNGTEGWGIAEGVGRGKGGSDPTTGPVDENGVMV